MAWENPLLATPSAQDDMRGIVADYIGSEQFTALIQSKSRRNLLRADLVTTLPVSPTEGDEIDYSPQDGVYWRFRYVSAQKPYPWVFVGGAPATSSVETSQSVATTGAWYDLGTVGPSYTIPFAGYYIVSFTAQGLNTGSATQLAAGIAFAAGTPFVYAEVWTAGANYVGQLTVSDSLQTFTTAQSELRLRYYQSVANSNIRYRRIAVSPVRVG